MVMQFTRLLLQGFKSFVDPADLVISAGLTGVVGPNACGKSNLLEALRWVMGESRAKQMRRDEMEDVIFAGAASRPARGRLRAIAQTRGFADPDVMLRWAEAVGPALSAICRPVKVSYSGSVGATLIARVDGAHAPEVDHSRLRIIDRINAFFGYRAISRIKITQATGLRGFAEEPPTRGGASLAASLAEPPPAPNEEAVEKAAALADGIRDPDLRDAVTRKGAWIFSEDGESPARESHSVREVV